MYISRNILVQKVNKKEVDLPQCLIKLIRLTLKMPKGICWLILLEFFQESYQFQECRGFN